MSAHRSTPGSDTGVGAAAPDTRRPRPGRPPLTERRKEATRLEIAHEAVRLFTERGVSRTSGEDIAEAAGISTRTLWRYFPAKEECVRPLLTHGLERMARRLLDTPADQPLFASLEFVDAPDAEEPDDPEQLRTLRGLIRLTRTEPAIMAVWLQVHHAAEDLLADAVAARLRVPADSLDARVRAAMVNSALRVAVESWALGDIPAVDSGTPGRHDALRRAMDIIRGGLDC